MFRLPLEQHKRHCRKSSPLQIADFDLWVGALAPTLIFGDAQGLAPEAPGLESLFLAALIVGPEGPIHKSFSGAWSPHTKIPA